MTIGSETCSVNFNAKDMVLVLDIVRFSRPPSRAKVKLNRCRPDSLARGTGGYSSLRYGKNSSTLAPQSVIAQVFMDTFLTRKPE